MKVWISDADNKTVTKLEFSSEQEGDSAIACLEGELPEGLSLQDLSTLGIVNYKSGNRGKPIPEICPVEPSENLDYIRALTEALPPGYHVSKVESPVIDELREQKALLFFQEIEALGVDSGGSTAPDL